MKTPCELSQLTLNYFVIVYRLKPGCVVLSHWYYGLDYHQWRVHGPLVPPYLVMMFGTWQYLVIQKPWQVGLDTLSCQC